MHDALATCQENFRLYWGQKLVNTLRALHEVRYASTEEEEEFPVDEHDDDLKPYLTADDDDYHTTND